jgi:hypothetical protein
LANNEEFLRIVRSLMGGPTKIVVAGVDLDETLSSNHKSSPQSAEHI